MEGSRKLLKQTAHIPLLRPGAKTTECQWFSDLCTCVATEVPPTLDLCRLVHPLTLFPPSVPLIPPVCPQDRTGTCPAGYYTAVLFVLVTMTLWVGRHVCVCVSVVCKRGLRSGHACWSDL